MITKIIFIFILMFVIIGCGRAVSIDVRKFSEPFISYFLEKSVLDPILFPNSTKPEIESKKSEIAKELYNLVWNDFGIICSDYEDFESCKNKVIESQKVWIDNYTQNFLSDYRSCKQGLMRQNFDIYNTLTKINECLINKNQNYGKLIELSANNYRRNN